MVQHSFTGSPLEVFNIIALCKRIYLLTFVRHRCLSNKRAICSLEMVVAVIRKDFCRNVDVPGTA